MRWSKIESASAWERLDLHKKILREAGRMTRDALSMGGDGLLARDLQLTAASRALLHQDVN
eukprot:1047603-Karenia_brevis.AAC.1